MHQKITKTTTQWRFCPGIGFNVWQDSFPPDVNAGLPAARFTYILFLCFLITFTEADYYFTPRTGKEKKHGNL